MKSVKEHHTKKINFSEKISLSWLDWWDLGKERSPGVIDDSWENYDDKTKMETLLKDLV